MSLINRLKLFNKNPQMLFYTLPFAVSSGFEMWRAILNNYVYEQANFTGKDIGILQSVREIPGLLAITVLLFLLIFSEQLFTVISLLLMGSFIVAFGYYDDLFSLSIICLFLSFGFHYNETISKSLSTQLLEHKKLSPTLGKAKSISSMVTIASFITIYVLYKYHHVNYKLLFTLGGSLTILVALYIFIAFPRYKIHTKQKGKPKLYKKYWLYYVLNILSGGRRQLFVVFAPFLLVESFGLEIDKLIGAFLISQLSTMYLAPKMGKLILKIGERNALLLEYSGLVFIFLGYMFVQAAWQGITLYVLDNILFSISFAIATYFKRIADPKDIASTAAVSFTLNHLIAVILPLSLGFIWLHYSHKYVFAAGAVISLLSLLVSFLIPSNPERGYETIFSKVVKLS